MKQKDNDSSQTLKKDDDLDALNLRLGSIYKISNIFYREYFPKLLGFSIREISKIWSFSCIVDYLNGYSRRWEPNKMRKKNRKLFMT